MLATDRDRVVADIGRPLAIRGVPRADERFAEAVRGLDQPRAARRRRKRYPPARRRGLPA